MPAGCQETSYVYSTGLEKEGGLPGKITVITLTIKQSVRMRIWCGEDFYRTTPASRLGQYTKTALP
jgi:hypothetical protein